MASEFLVEFDDLMEQILLDYKNLDPSPDVNEGSIVYIKAACLASMLWGLYRFQDYIAKQEFPDTADTDNLNHWGAIYGIARNSGEADSAYAARILQYLQSPPAGGTALDYKNWSLSVTTTINAQENFLPAAVNIGTNQITTAAEWVQDSATFPNIVTFATNGTLPSGLSAGTQYYVNNVDATHITVSTTRGGLAISLLTQGTGTHTIVPDTTVLYHAESVNVVTPPAVLPGTVTIVVAPNRTDDSLGSADVATFLTSAGMTTLLNAIYAYIETVRPVTAASTSVVATSGYSTAIDITVTPATLTTTQLSTMVSDIAAFMSTLVPGQVLFHSKLEAICVNDGAESANVTTPSADIYPTQFQVVLLSGTPTVHI
jgi:uncharacterized phage protein gp47/JayE